MTARNEYRDVSGGRTRPHVHHTMGNYVPVLPAEPHKSGRPPDTSIAERGRRALDHRASAANAGRREDRGEPVERCTGCRCETDVPVAAHSLRCAGG